MLKAPSVSEKNNVPLPHDPRHPAHLAVGEPDLDPVGVEGGVGEDLLHHPFGQLPRPLVALEDDLDLHPRLYVLSVLAVHAPSAPFRLGFGPNSVRIRSGFGSASPAPPCCSASDPSRSVTSGSLDLQEEEVEDEGLSRQGVVGVEGDRLFGDLGDG